MKCGNKITLSLNDFGNEQLNRDQSIIGMKTSLLHCLVRGSKILFLLLNRMSGQWTLWQRRRNHASFWDFSLTLAVVNTRPACNTEHVTCWLFAISDECFAEYLGLDPFRVLYCGCTLIQKVSCLFRITRISDIKYQMKLHWCASDSTISFHINYIAYPYPGPAYICLMRFYHLVE